jgi:hypothetical protein
MNAGHDLASMTLDAKNLELRLGDSGYGLSARRLWEHAHLGQVNVGCAINPQKEWNYPAAFIDVVHWFNGETFALTGITLGALSAGQVPGPKLVKFPVSRNVADGAAGRQFQRSVGAFLDQLAVRKAARNQEHRFLPPGCTEDPFGVPLLWSSLQRRLRRMGGARAGAEQWRKTIENFQKTGLRAEELDRSDLVAELAHFDTLDRRTSGGELAQRCFFDGLRLSIIPVIDDAQCQLRFTSTPPKTFKRTKKLPKAQAGQTRAAVRFDPILGYRLEQIEHLTVWGGDRHWQAVAPDGAVVQMAGQQSLMATAEAAGELAASHAKLYYPKRVALGRWGHIAWTGGQDYREWLITIPFYPASYFSSHFRVRNVLAHVRCDLREGAAGERILLLQEVQSDWAQNARRGISCGDMDPSDEACPPFLKEWPALVMKLVVLHAACQGLDGVTWTRGAHQAARYRGLGATGLTELYDRTLPREVNRILKPFGCACETLGVYVPANFRVQQSEEGYEVFSAENELLGTAPTLEDARAFVPDGAHERLYEVHGIKLPTATRSAILATGFPAWGY